MNFSSTQKLQVVLSASATTTELPVTAHYRESFRNTAGRAASVQVPRSQYSTTTGATAVDVLDAAAASDQYRTLEKLTIYNADTVAATATVRINNGGSNFTLFTRVIPVGQTLLYENGTVTLVGDASTTGRIVTLTAQGTKYDTFTTAKSMLPAAAIPTLPANYWTVGKQMRIRGVAGLSNIVTTPGTLTLQVMVGSVIAFTSGALQLNATAHTLLPLFFKILMTCRAIGSGTTAKFQGNGWVQGIHPTLTAAQTDAANTGGIFSIPATAPALGTGFDSTAAQAIDLWAGFSISNSGNAFQIEQYTVDII